MRDPSATRVSPAAGGAGGVLLPADGGRGRDYLPLLLGLAGFASGLIILGFDWDRDPASISFASTPAFLMWLGLIAGQTALWLGLAVPLYRGLREFRFERGVGLKSALYVAGALAVVYFGYRPEPPLSPLAHHKEKMALINLIGAGVVLLPLAGIWLAQSALARMQAELDGEQAMLGGGGVAAYRADVVETFLRMRTHLERFLLAAGVFVGAATLATGGLRNAVVANKGHFPREHVLLYGLVASGLLALIYTPAHARLVAVRARLRDLLQPLPAQRPESWAAWQSERRAVEELLEVHSGVIASFAGSVSILTPLFGSLIAILVGDK